MRSADPIVWRHVAEAGECVALAFKHYLKNGYVHDL
jgi:hypothetical protein